MYFWDAVGVLGRRWYVVLPMLILTGAFSAAVMSVVPIHYRATGDILFLPPQAATADRPPANPYLSFGSTLGATADIISRTMMSQNTAMALFDAGNTAEYSVGLSEGGAPILHIETTASNSEVAKRTLESLITLGQEELARRQQVVKAPQGSYITADVVAHTALPDAMYGSRVRALAAVGVLGVILSVSMAFFAEGYGQRGRRRHHAEPAPSGVRTGVLNDVPGPGPALGQATPPGSGQAPPHHAAAADSTRRAERSLVSGEQDS